jgi:SRSO17 transposase
MAGAAHRFSAFFDRYMVSFVSKTRSMADTAEHYLQGLMRPGKKNMERIAEKVPHSEHQSLHHFVSNSPWDEREVIGQVARDADRHLGGDADSALYIDESGIAKKGNMSVGVRRQWLGRLGKVDNGQVAVFAALGCREHVVPVDVRLFLPKSWTSDKERCLAAGVPEEHIVAKTKQELALEMVRQARAGGMRFNWIGADAFYGMDPAFLRALDAAGECFVIDVHRDQFIHLQDPKPYVPCPKNKRGRKPTKLITDKPAIRVDAWAAGQSDEAWQTARLRSSTRGELIVQVLHRHVWLWNGKEQQARPWRLIVRRELDKPDEIKYSLSNADDSVSVERLAYMQAQRYWIEFAFQEAKTHCGMADYQVRNWRGWHHHMAMVMMAMLFHLEERLLHKETVPLLTPTDIVALLNVFLPQQRAPEVEVFNQIEARHKKRLASAKSAKKKQLKKYGMLLAMLM